MRLYHKGDRGEPVRDVQDRLSALDHPCEPDESGVFGESTFEAVSNFQSQRGLPVDGIVGPETWRAIVDAGYRLGDRLLYRRVPMMRGDDVSNLQALLNSLGFDTGKVDGIFGPDTLTGLMDFQRNRGLAEDGISGRIVRDELSLIEMATQKHGREAVRERQWLASLPSSIAGQRIYLDPECRDPREGREAWSAATAAFSAFQLLGASPMISRSIDTDPPARLRAQRANRVNPDIVVGFLLVRNGDEAVYFFQSAHSRSEGGMEIAAHLAKRLGVKPQGKTLPMLKETRSPAVVVALRSISRRTGRVVANSLASMYEG
ncbi:MAG: N-acetylmuramoyl-L-alanine amidase [Acidimicrobiia bacterium]|nr:MAG: N-acetylmuramoyl-L-alanine amidase [Acidimicrobiia bacterium]